MDSKPENPPKLHRKNLRLKGYDYSSAGGYFVTICVKNHEKIFGVIHEDDDQKIVMILNDFGRVVQKVWISLPEHNSCIELNAFQIMPNHVHGIIIIHEYERGKKIKSKPNLSGIIRQFKSFSAIKINTLRGTTGTSLWQRNYYDRVIRDEDELCRFRNYIIDNPRRWAEDPESRNE